MSRFTYTNTFHHLFINTNIIHVSTRIFIYIYEHHSPLEHPVRIIIAAIAHSPLTALPRRLPQGKAERGRAVQQLAALCCAAPSFRCVRV